MGSSVPGVFTGEIYRHFKGGLYTIMDVARDCDDPARLMVVYKSLIDGKVWTRRYEDFRSLVPEDRANDEKQNPYHQLYRFERVEFTEGGALDLKAISTDQLVSELKTRPDNPYESWDVVETTYYYGTYNENNGGLQPIATHNTLDGLRDILAKRKGPIDQHSRNQFFKRVFYRV